MTLPKRALIAVLPLALCGCLEVNQHPAWLDGGYAGKIDQLPYQQHFHRDQLAWSAALTNRALYQNEYVRAKPPGMAGAKRPGDVGGTPAQNAQPGQPGTGPATPQGAGQPAGGQGAAAPGAMQQPAAAAGAPAASGAARPPASR